MEKLDKLTGILIGKFDNSRQFNEMSKEEQKNFPYAVHRNHLLNGDIHHLPENFEGAYIHEESYYTLNGKEKFKSDVFLFSYNEDGDVVLNSVVVPREATNCKYEEIKNIEFDELSLSTKFTPLIYTETDGTFVGESKSMFTQKTSFFLWQKLSDEQLIIKEEMHNGEKRIFGFDKPIVYERQSN